MPTPRKYMIELAVFISGGVVMIYEIVGSRIISPYIGTSTYTWTSLIGVILAALSLGYWLGGRWADKRPDMKILATVIFIAGGLVSATILIKEPFLLLVSNTGLPLEVSSVLAAVVLFAPAAVMLGFVTPYAVKLSITTVDHTGRTVGRLYALSTIGSIAGTFLAGFVLIPFVGSTRTLYILAAVLFGVSLALLPFALSQLKVALLVMFAGGIAFNEGMNYYLLISSNYHDFDTEYNRIRIFDTKKDGRPLRALVVDPFTYQSSMYLDNGESGAHYTSYYHLAGYFKPDFKSSLIIGGAAYSFPKDYLKTYPTASIEVVEIDPGMTNAAKQYFGLKEDPRLTITHRDGRIFLNKARPKQFDVVFVDAFNSLFSVPFQLTTVEAVREISKVLKSDGVVLVNIGTAVSGSGSQFLDAEVATYKRVFSDLRLFQTDAAKDKRKIQNVILIASNRHLGSTKSRGQYEKLLISEIDAARPAAPVLTDDLAPVERYNSIAQRVSAGIK